MYVQIRECVSIPVFIRSGHFERRNSVINGSFHCSIKMLLFMKRQTQRVLFFFLMVLKTQFDKCVPSGSTVYHIFLFLSQNKLHKQDDFRIPTVFFPSYQNKYSLIRAGSILIPLFCDLFIFFVVVNSLQSHYISQVRPSALMCV